jgi:hypothetical protein
LAGTALVVGGGAVVVEAFEIYVSHTGLVEVGGGLGKIGEKKDIPKKDDLEELCL